MLSFHVWIRYATFMFHLSFIFRNKSFYSSVFLQAMLLHRSTLLKILHWKIQISLKVQSPRISSLSETKEQSCVLCDRKMPVKECWRSSHFIISFIAALINPLNFHCNSKCCHWIKESLVNKKLATDRNWKQDNWCLQDTYVIYKTCFQKSTIYAEWITMNWNYHHNVDVALWCCDIILYMETGVSRHQ